MITIERFIEKMNLFAKINQEEVFENVRDIIRETMYGSFSYIEKIYVNNGELFADYTESDGDWHLAHKTGSLKNFLYKHLYPDEINIIYARLKNYANVAPNHPLKDII